MSWQIDPEDASSARHIANAHSAIVCFNSASSDIEAKA